MDHWSASGVHVIILRMVDNHMLYAIQLAGENSASFLLEVEYG